MKYLASITLLVAALLPFSAPAQDEAPGWTDRIKFKGDVRLRHESIDEEGEAGRDRQRFRMRFGASAKVADDITFVLQLATGGDDPVSTNQTFDGGFSTKDIGIDRAYVDWKANDYLNVYAGKMKNPLFQTGKVPLVWDGDLNPEGVAAAYKNGAFFANAGWFTVEERSSDDESMLYAVQLGGKFAIGETATLTAGVGYFGYSDTIGFEPFYNGRAKGNSVDIDGNYIHEYKNTELFAQFDTEVGDLPLSIYAQWVQNGEVDIEDTATAFGTKIGSAKSKGDWEASWTYMDIEADAVIGTFSDSDFGGGGTDASGHVLKGKYAVSKRVSVGGTYFINDVDHFQGTEHDYDRLQLDVEFKFE